MLLCALFFIIPYNFGSCIDRRRIFGRLCRLGVTLSAAMRNVHISTGSRAFLDYLERLSLPGITALA
ncbi:MAG TPA: hypothetical protein DDZ37_06065 [Spirochaetaceae bacterium]|nr:hypothetical protein [Spirochaetaceae bacterium]